MSRKQHLLIVDDDPQIGQLLSDYLSKYDYRVFTAKDGIEMQRVLKEATIDLVILDVMLPGEDGISLCRRLRDSSDVSIIMLSAVDQEADRVAGLEVGADDYLTKPFSPRELLARIKALLRRSTGELGQLRKESSIASVPNLEFSGWVLDQKKRRLLDPDGITVALSHSEYELLLAFIEHPQRVLTRDQLLDLTKGKTATPFDRSIDVQVGRLRKKIEIDAKNPRVITTVRGGGYQFNAEIMERAT